MEGAKLGMRASSRDRAMDTLSEMKGGDGAGFMFRPIMDSGCGLVSGEGRCNRLRRLVKWIEVFALDPTKTRYYGQPNEFA